MVQDFEELPTDGVDVMTGILLFANIFCPSAMMFSSLRLTSMTTAFNDWKQLKHYDISENSNDEVLYGTMSLLDHSTLYKNCQPVIYHCKMGKSREVPFIKYLSSCKRIFE